MKLTKATLKSLIKEELLKESSGMGMSGGRDLKTVGELVEELSEIILRPNYSRNKIVWLKTLKLVK